jgi:hypothetical protein
MNETGKTQTDLDEDAAEAAALAAAVEQARADPRSVPHDEMREWLLKIANGDFAAPPPVPR